MDAEQDITRLLDDWRDDDGSALERLVPYVYDELRRIAHRQLRHQPYGHTLNTTALVHETYLRMAGGARLEWNDRAHFFALAARAMRQILIDYARRFGRAKRGGAWRRIPLDEGAVAVEEKADFLLALDEALGRLAVLDERLCRVVEYRFFGGMTEAEVGAALGVTARTVRRDWLKAKLWLYAELVEEGAA